MNKKKVYIDVTQFIQIDALTGIQRVMRELIFRLLKNPELETVLICYRPNIEKYELLRSDGFLLYYQQGMGKKSAFCSQNHMRIEELERGAIFFEIDVAWSAFLKRSYLLPMLKKQGLILVSMIYDIMAITHFQYFHPLFTYEFMEFISAHILYDDLILVNTADTRDTLISFAKRAGVESLRVEVVPLGGDFQGREDASDSTEQVQESVMQTAGLKPYLLLVGTIEPRKNHKLLYEAYKRRLHEEEINIIFAGRVGWIEKEFMETLYQDPDFGTRIHHISNASNNDLRYLYHHAFAVAFPTHMEGYGLPVVEALENGDVVIASDIPVLREVGGDYCIYFKENDVDDFSQKVVDLMHDKESYSTLREHISAYRVHTWDQTAEQVALLLRSGL